MKIKSKFDIKPGMRFVSHEDGETFYIVESGNHSYGWDCREYIVNFDSECDEFNGYTRVSAHDLCHMDLAPDFIACDEHTRERRVRWAELPEEEFEDTPIYQMEMAYELFGAGYGITEFYRDRADIILEDEGDGIFSFETDDGERMMVYAEEEIFPDVWLPLSF